VVLDISEKKADTPRVLAGPQGTDCAACISGSPNQGAVGSGCRQRLDGVEPIRAWNSSLQGGIVHDAASDVLQCGIACNRACAGDLGC
jgi:hypothetical protein